jgi:hypothetical protein
MTKLELLELSAENVECVTPLMPNSLTIDVDSFPEDIYVEINGRTIKISKQKLEKLLLTLQDQ